MYFHRFAGCPWFRRRCWLVCWHHAYFTALVLSLYRLQRRTCGSTSPRPPGYNTLSLPAQQRRLVLSLARQWAARQRPSSPGGVTMAWKARRPAPHRGTCSSLSASPCSAFSPWRSPVHACLRARSTWSTTTRRRGLSCAQHWRAPSRPPSRCWRRQRCSVSCSPIGTLCSPTRSSGSTRLSRSLACARGCGSNPRLFPEPLATMPHSTMPQRSLTLDLCSSHAARRCSRRPAISTWSPCSAARSSRPLRTPSF